MQYVLVETCWAAPEQYDVYHGNAVVGGIHVRGGCLCAYAGGDLVHDAKVDGDGRMTELERYGQLVNALQAIHAHHRHSPGFAFYVQGRT